MSTRTKPHLTTNEPKIQSLLREINSRYPDQVERSERPHIEPAADEITFADGSQGRTLEERELFVGAAIWLVGLAGFIGIGRLLYMAFKSVIS